MDAHCGGAAQLVSIIIAPSERPLLHCSRYPPQADNLRDPRPADPAEEAAKGHYTVLILQATELLPGARPEEREAAVQVTVAGFGNWLSGG